jgi:hypothetical protein
VQKHFHAEESWHAVEYPVTGTDQARKGKHIKGIWEEIQTWAGHLISDAFKASFCSKFKEVELGFHTTWKLTSSESVLENSKQKVPWYRSYKALRMCMIDI